MFNINYTLAKSIQKDHRRAANKGRLARQLAQQQKRLREKLAEKTGK
jgi:hypothetical protein